MEYNRDVSKENLWRKGLQAGLLAALLYFEAPVFSLANIGRVLSSFGAGEISCSNETAGLRRAIAVFGSSTATRPDGTRVLNDTWKRRIETAAEEFVRKPAGIVILVNGTDGEADSGRLQEEYFRQALARMGASSAGVAFVQENDSINTATNVLALAELVEEYQIDVVTPVTSLSHRDRVLLHMHNRAIPVDCVAASDDTPTLFEVIKETAERILITVDPYGDIPTFFKRWQKGH